MILSPDNNVLRWKRRLSGYRVPVIEEIVVEKQSLPIISILCFTAALVLFLFWIRRKQMLLGGMVLLIVVGIGFSAYPFVRFSMNLPFTSQLAPSNERSAVILDDLLTNVYRSFDLRDEEDVYDRLAMSVIGEQLTQIYLENRKSLELENRGGAQAKVDKLKLIEIYFYFARLL
jgi:hypothetical protein